MSQYGFKGLNYGTVSLGKDVSGFTFTINPLHTPNVGDPHGYGTPTATNQTNGASGKWSLLDPSIDPYVTYINNDPNINWASELSATTPIFWVLSIHEITNPRLEALMNSNNSGTGTDVRFFLQGSGGRYDTANNINRSRTSDALFIPIDDPYFNTANASPFTAGTAFEQNGVGSLGQVHDVLATGLSPYNWITNGDGTASGSVATSPTSTAKARARSRTFVTKEPTLSFQEGVGNAFQVDANKHDQSSFSLHCEVYESGTWSVTGILQNVVGYRSSIAYFASNTGGGDVGAFPGSTYTGVYTDWYGQLHNGLTFNYAPPWQFTSGGSAWLRNADYNSWTSAFSTTLGVTKGFPVSLPSSLGVNAGSPYRSDISVMYTQDMKPAWNFGANIYDMSCGAYFEAAWTLTTGVGKNFDTHIDDEAEGGGTSADEKSIFGYQDSQGAHSITSTSCNHTTTAMSNTTSNNQLRHVDHHEYWYAFTPFNHWNASKETVGNNAYFTSMAPSSYMFNQPTCGDVSQWESQIIEHEYIPAPILDSNLKEFYWGRVRPNNTWNVPGGVEKIEMWSNPSYTAQSTFILDQNTWTLVDWKVKHNNYCTSVNLNWWETKAMCEMEAKGHQPSAALEIGDWNITTTDETCTAQGSIDFEFDWTVPCNGRFYDYAPDDYIITVKLHLSLNNTGVVTHTVTTTTTNSDMNFNPGNGSGDASGTTTGSISVPCGDYYCHSIEVMPMTSTMFTSGNAGDAYTWTAGNGGTTWAGFTNSNNEVGCAPSPPTMTCSSTNVQCGSLGTFTANWSGGTQPYTVQIFNSSGAISGTFSGNATTYTATGLSADSYTAIVTDSAGCTDNCSQIITAVAAGLLVSDSIQHPTHCINPTGNITLTATGGTSPYTVSWDQNGTAISATGLILNPVPSGTYNWTVTDAQGCTATGSSTVNNAPTLGMSCAPATIGLDPSGAGLSDGIVQVSIQNNSGATYVTGAAVNLYDPNVYVYDSLGNLVAQNGTWDPWNDFFGQGTSSNWQITGLPADTYTIDIVLTPNIGSGLGNLNTPITIPAPTSCQMTCTVTLTDPGSTPIVTVGTITGETCNPGTDGTIQLTASGGSTNAFHHWDFTLCTDAGMTIGCQTFSGTSTFGDNTTGNVHTFTGLVAGTYYATVTPCFGVNGLTCQTASPVTIGLVVPAIGGPTIVLTPIHPSCPGASDGGFTQVTSGGTGPYLYQWDCDTYCSSGFQPVGGTNWASGNTTALPADTYYVNVIDANNCVGTAQVTLVDPPAIDFTQTPPHPTTNPATCGASDGSVTFTFATGGTITPPMLSFTYTLFNSGGVQVAQQLGTGAVVNQFTGLAADTYTLRATDSNGCYEEITFTIALETFTVAVNHSDQGCTFPPSNDGSLQLVVTPYANVPVPNYTYLWTHAPSGTVIQNETIAGTTSTQLTGLAADIYNWSVTDGNGCVVTGNQVINLSADTQENVAVTEIGMACPTGCGILKVSNTTGDFPLYVEISDDAGATWTRVSTTSNTAATAFTSIDLAPPGIQIDQSNYYKENSTQRFCFNMGSTYHIRTFSQANSCPSVAVIHTMSNTAYVPMVHVETLTQPTCCSCNNLSCNGVISNRVTGGIGIPQGAAGGNGVGLMSFDWTLTHDGMQIGSQTGAVFAGGVTYVVSSSSGSPTNLDYDTIVFSGLYPGTYVFTTTDDCGETVSETWTLIDPRVYITDITTNQPLCQFGCDDGTITVTATGGDSGTYQFSMDDGITWQPAVASANTSYTFTGVGPGTWNIWARDPSCGSQILFDSTDNVLTSANGCYSDFITGIWPAGTQSTLTPVSDLNTQWVSTTNNSLPGSSDGAIEINILGGQAPYEVSVLTSANMVSCDGCALQTAGVIPAGLSQYIDLNGAAVSNTGITSIASNGSLVIDNLSVSLDYNGTALGAWYTIYVKDAAGCFSCISQYVDNGTLGIIGIYAAEDCNCSCPDGYSLIVPPPAPPALPCAGTSPVAPTFIGAFNSPNSIQQFGAANLTSAGYGGNGGRLYVPAGGNANVVTAVNISDTFVRSNTSSWPPPLTASFVSPGSGTVLEVAGDGGGFPQGYGSIFDTRLWDIGVWPQQGPTSPANPVNEWIGIPIELDFGGPQSCILGISGDGNYKVTLDCGTFLTTEDAVPGTQIPAIDAINYKEYVMIPVLIPEGKHTLTFWVKNDTTNASPDQVAGIAFDLFQGVLSNGLSVTSVFVGATTQAQLDPYYILDVNGKKITSRNITAGTYDHDFLMGTTNGFQCASECLFMENGNITCLSDDTADCTLPINCPEYLSDLVECVGTLSNEVYTKMISGLLENKLDIREVWLVILTKYLIKNLNPCITLQDLLSWAKFLEDICPDCENNFEGTRELPDPNEGTPFGGGPGTNTYDF